MKFFSLIFGDSLQRAPQKKIIPSQEFSSLLEADELLTHVKQEAEKYRLQVTQECETLKEEAEKKGFDAGLEKWNQQIALLETEIGKVQEEVKKVVIPLALKAAKKIVGREIEIAPDTAADIAVNSLRAVSQHRRITIYCSKHDLESLEKNRERLRAVFEHLESLSIQEREDVQQGGCVIETEAGIINAQIDRQWEALERALTSTKPSP
jgi:type III secretion protein L